MPSAPLYYQPLVQARVLATPIGDTTVYDAQQLQKERTQKAYEQYAPAMDGILRGFEGMQGSMPGSKSLDLIQFAYDDTGYIANRVATAMRLHPNLFDTASPDQAAEIGANLVQQAAKELSEDPGMKAVGDTLEVTPKATALFEKHWIGANPLAPEEIAYLGVVTGRELQHAVTPTEPDSEHKLQWIEDAGAEILALWPGAAARTAAALGVKLDEAGAAAVGTVVDGWRQDKTASDEHLRSTIALLGAAGIAGTDDAAANATFAVLQSTPLEGVPMGIAQAIVGQGKLPDEAVPYVAGRIVETGGSEGNVKGLLAELEQLQQPAPGVPPPIEPPPAEPPPVEPPPVEPPPVEPPPAEPPPVEPPPVDEPASVTS